MHTSLFHFKLISIFLLLIMTLISGYLPFHQKFKNTQNSLFPSNFSWALAFSQGVFLGAGLIHLLGDASSQFLTLGYQYPFAFLLAGLAFLLLWIFEESIPITSMALIGTLMLSIHSLLEGSALGLTNNLVMAGIILTAILAHKWAAGFAIAVKINQSHYGFLSRVFLFLIFAFMTPLGILIGTAIHHDFSQAPLLEPCFNSLAAGTFIYLGISHGPENPNKNLDKNPKDKLHHLQYFSLLLIGFGLMAVVAIWT